MKTSKKEKEQRDKERDCWVVSKTMVKASDEVLKALANSVGYVGPLVACTDMRVCIVVVEVESVEKWGDARDSCCLFFADEFSMNFSPLVYSA